MGDLKLVGCADLDLATRELMVEKNCYQLDNSLERFFLFFAMESPLVKHRTYPL